VKRTEIFGTPVEIRPDDGRTAMMIVARQDHVPDPWPGSITVTCSACGAPCWRSPQTLAVEVIAFFCTACAIAAGAFDPDAERFITPEAWDVARRAMD
jgi:hypothetical protein